MTFFTLLQRILLLFLCYCGLLISPARAQQASQLASTVVPTPVNTSSPDLATDASKTTAAVLSPGVGSNAASERVQFNAPIPAGTTAAGVSLRFDNVALSLVQAGLLPNVSIVTYLDGVATGDKWTSGQLLSLSLLQSGQSTDIKLNPAPAKSFNQLELRAEGLVNAYTLNFFAAFGPAPGPLPVSLLSFTATKQAAAVRLAWATASEVNSAYFEVERSTDGTTFGRLGQALAAGTSPVAHTYHFVDASPRPGVLYYRLRQVDHDGTASYGPVCTVDFAPAASQLAVYPAPARAQTTLSGAAAGAEVQVLNAHGQLVLRGQADAAGVAQLLLPAGLAPGIYVVRAGRLATRLTVSD